MKTTRRFHHSTTKRVRRKMHVTSRFIVTSLSVLIVVMGVATWVHAQMPQMPQRHAPTMLLQKHAHLTMPDNTMTPHPVRVNQNIQKRFTLLSQAHSDACSHLGDQPAIAAEMAAMPRGSFLQGSCCSPMDLQHYEQQIAALKAYTDLPQVPQDPYNVPVSLAITLLHDDQHIHLSADQQTVYTQAARRTQDSGWCCCQCWAWYAHSGLAKYVIAAKHFSVTQIVTLINAEDCCGGA